MNLRILSVNVSRPRVIGQLHGEDVWSGIDKKPVAEDSVFVGRLDIDGDAQADLSVHGGVDKAVYVYPADHWPWWEQEKSFGCGPARFGENLTLQGGDEHAVAIGDRFRWGDALLEVSQPRAPCYKLAIHARRDIPQLMTVSARCGCSIFASSQEEARVSRDATLERVTRSNGAKRVRNICFAFGIRG